MDEMQELAADQDYAALHPLSVLAFVLGIASTLAFVSVVLCVIPALAIGVALRALAKIAASEGARRGAGLARLGAALAVFCLAGVVTRDAVDDTLAKRQTFEVAQSWVELLTDNQLSESLELLSPRNVHGMMPQASPEAEPLTDDQVRVIATKKMEREELVQKLATLKQPPHLEVSQWSASPVRDRKTTRFMGNFLLASPTTPLGTLKLYFARTEDFEKTGAAWRIDSWQYTPE